MKVSMSTVQPTVKKFTELKSMMAYSSIMGDYKTFKTVSKEFASLAVKDFDVARTAPGAKIENIPLFSEYGRNMLKVMFLNLFRVRTPEEKLLRKMVNEYKAKQFIKQLVGSK